MFDQSTVLVTGGTGSFGKAFIGHLLSRFNVKKVIIFSRDELKQLDLRNYFNDDKRLRWFIGDIRDKERLQRAFDGVDFVVHAAALKQVDTGEYNPREFILTNIFGSQNVIDASIDCGVKKVIALSTDKASSPVNLYGATKLTADKLFSAANVYASKSKTIFSVVRYGNVVGSRGSIVPLIRGLVKDNMPIPVTDIRMTRFWIKLDIAVKFVIESFMEMQGGEIFIPKIPSFKIVDLISALAPNSELNVLGIRPGEKLHEEMLSEDDARRAIDLKNKFILPPIGEKWNYVAPTGQKLPENFSYKSNTNDHWLTTSEIIEQTKDII
jgi:UDP-N-acetylglucosamine 4,6-dehydratase